MRRNDRSERTNLGESAMKKPRYVPVVALLLLLTVAAQVPLFAGSESRKGTAGAMELLIPVGSRGTALGGSTNALASGVEAIHWNPGGMVRAKGVEVMFSTLTYLADTRLNYFAVASNFGEIGSFGLSLRSLDFGEIPITTVDQPEGTGGTYSPNFITGAFTFSRAFTDRINGGVSVKLISERIVRTSASGFAFDVGVQYGSKETGLKLGIALKNLGAGMNFDGPDLEYFADIPGQEPGSRQRPLRVPGASFELPSTLEIGLGYEHKMQDNHLLSITGDFQNTNFGSDEYRFGAEYGYNDRLFFRGGYMLTPNNEDNIYGPTFGVGVKLPLETSMVEFDYAYRQAEFFDANQWLTVKLGF